MADIGQDRPPYECRQCGREVNLKEGEPVRCNYCGYRILYKTSRSPRKVKAR